MFDTHLKQKLPIIFKNNYLHCKKTYLKLIFTMKFFENQITTMKKHLIVDH